MKPFDLRIGVALGAGLAALVLVAVLIVLGGDNSEDFGTGPSASLPAGFSGPIDDGFVRRSLAPGETPDQDYGIVLADVETGEGEFWSVPSTEAGTRLTYGVDSSHRWLWLADGSNPPRWIIADRETGESYELNRGDWRVVAGPTPKGLLLLN